MSETYRMKDGYINKHNSSELSEEISCDTSDPYNLFSDHLSPIPPSIVPRKLDFTNVDDEDVNKDASMTPMALSPPYKRVRALRLFDSPRTPKTLLDKCSTPSQNHSRTRLFPPRLQIPSRVPSGSSHYLHPPSDDDSALGSFLPDDSSLSRSRRPVANINPFTPQGQALRKKRSLTTPTRDASPEQPAKRLRESNISRYQVEFEELGVIGRGEFGVVTKCRNILDGITYAIKRSIKPVAGSAAERTALNEVWAHAALGKHPHVVRYYSAWAEDDHMVIQNEYCDGGSLQGALAGRGPLAEPELLVLLQHVADGLQYIHSQNLVHMDVKPGNIFISRRQRREPSSGHSSDSEDDEPPANNYKLGDLGHVTDTVSPVVEEGDCRYLPREVLQEDFTHLFKADIFAFGLTLFEAAGGGPLPQNGQEWQDIRDGILPDLPNVSREFNHLLKQMIHPDPCQRPSAARLRKHPLLARAPLPSRSDLARELAATNLRNEVLTKQLQEATRYIKSVTPTIQANGESAKFRTRAAKRLQPQTLGTNYSGAARKNNMPKVDAQLAEFIQSVTSPPPASNNRTVVKRGNRGSKKV